MAKRKKDIAALRAEYKNLKRATLAAGRRLGEATGVHKPRTGTALERMRFAALRQTQEGQSQIERDLEAIYAIPQPRVRRKGGYFTPKVNKTKRNALRVKLFKSYLGAEGRPGAVARFRRRRTRYGATR